MNKRSRPASLTGSLLARKGQAEPAIEPYSFLDPVDGREKAPAGPSHAASADAGNADAGGSGGSPGVTATMDPTSSENSAGGQPSGHDIDGPSGPGDAAGTERERARDRRLLRFVYATAALTGVLALVIFAGDWFFPKPGQSGRVAETSPSVAPAPSGDGRPVAAMTERKPLTRLQVTEPPAPPSPALSPRAEANAGPKPDKTVAMNNPLLAGRSATGEQATDTRPPMEKPAVTSPSEPASIKPKPAPRAASGTAGVRPSAPPADKNRAASAKKPEEVPVSAPKTAALPAQGTKGRYYAQLGSVTSEAGAKSFWARVKKKFPDILGNYELTVEKRVVADRGTFYRVQVGRFETFKDVRGLCDLLKARKQGCLPVKR